MVTSQTEMKQQVSQSIGSFDKNIGGTRSKPINIRIDKMSIPEYNAGVNPSVPHVILPSAGRRGSYTLVNINSPDFRFRRPEREEEIINSVREDFLNSYKEKFQKSSTSEPSKVYGLKKNRSRFATSPAKVYSITGEEDPNLGSVGGDILREIYLMALPNRNNGLRRVKSTSNMYSHLHQGEGEEAERGLTASGVNVPGGFRREFILHKMREKHYKRQSENQSPSSGSGVDLGSVQQSMPESGSGSHLHSPIHSNIDSEGHEIRDIATSVFPASKSQEDPESNGDKNEEEVPFLTRNFMEFLYLYGHFAGESFVDDFLPDDDEDEFVDIFARDEDHPLIPTGDMETMKTQISTVRGTASAGKVFLLLLKSFVGTGVLFLPNGFNNGGLSFSIFALTFFGIYSYWCYYILVQAKVQTKVTAFGDIGGRLYGPWMKFLILLSIVLTQLGFAAAYMIFTAVNLSAFLKNVFNIQHISLALIMFFQLCFYTPLSFIRNISKLSIPSMVANFFIMTGLVIVMVFTLKHLCVDLDFKPAEGVIYGINLSRWTIFIGTAIFAFEGIGLIIPVQDSMKHPEKFPLILGLVMIVVTGLFITMATIGYLAYGSDIDTVILSNLPQSNIAVNLIQLFYSLAIMLSTPLQLFPAIKIIEGRISPLIQRIFRDDSAAGGQVTENEEGKTITNTGKKNWKVKWTKNLVRSIIVAIIVLIAYCEVNSLDRVVAIIGSFCCLPLVYVIPPMLHLRCCVATPRNERSKTKQILVNFDKVLIVFGLFSMFYTSYQTLFGVQ